MPTQSPHHLFPVVLLMLMTAQAPSATVSWQDGADNAFITNYNGTADVALDSGYNTFFNRTNTNRNFGSDGAETEGGAEPERGLLRFDLTAFAGRYAYITGISVILTNSSKVQNDYGTVTAYPVTQANSGWIEGTGSSVGDIIVGAPTWNQKAHDQENWAGSAGLGTPGVDYDSTVSASFSWNDLGQHLLNFSGSDEALTALIDHWAEDPLNAGILLISTSHHPSKTGWFRPISQEVTNILAHQRPILTITYQPAPNGPTFAAWAASHGVPAIADDDADKDGFTQLEEFGADRHSMRNA